MSIEWGSVANWASGIGSLVASCVALYVADRNRRIKLDGYVGKRVLIGGGLPKSEVLSISVTNHGPRAARINNVGMFAGRGKGKRYAIIDVSTPDLERPWIICDSIPKQIADGESANWQIYLGAEEKWIHELVSDGFVRSWLDVETLRFVIYTSQGFKKVIRPEKPVRDQLHDLVRARGEIAK